MRANDDNGAHALVHAAPTAPQPNEHGMGPGPAADRMQSMSRRPRPVEDEHDTMLREFAEFIDGLGLSQSWPNVVAVMRHAPKTLRRWTR